jgi:hypothetical protein
MCDKPSASSAPHFAIFPSPLCEAGQPLEGACVQHEVIGNPAIADASLDRLVRKAHRLPSKGDSMRKIAAIWGAES